MKSLDVDCQLIIWLQQLNGISARHIQDIYRYFGGFEAVLTSSEDDLGRCLERQAVRILLQHRCSFEHSLTELERLIDCWQTQGIHLLAITDDRYPQLLRTIYTPPALLYVRGEITQLSLPQIAMVGSRNYSPSGGENARLFARELAACGFIITSGLALGIDSMAHVGAMTTGSTIAVLGSGVESIYPRRHQGLADQILATGGALVSEFAPGTPPRAAHFPQRNRIISGLSLGVLVVEAALKSGSLITARTALEQGREVFAMPGSIHNPVARGCHQLIRDGATLVEQVHDIAEQLQGMVALKQLELNNDASGYVEKNNPLTNAAEKLLQSMGFDPIDFDACLARTGLTVTELIEQFTELELAGLIKQRGSCYQRVR